MGCGYTWRPEIPSVPDDGTSPQREWRELPPHEVQERASGEQPTGPTEALERSSASPQLSPDGKWWWTGVEWVLAAHRHPNREPAIGASEQSEDELYRRALQVKALYGSDALSLKELRVLQDGRRRQGSKRGGKGQ